MLLFFSGLLKNLRCPENSSDNVRLSQYGWEVDLSRWKILRDFALKKTRSANRRSTGSEGFTNALKTVTRGLRRPVSVEELLVLQRQGVPFPADKKESKNRGIPKNKWNPKMSRFTFGAVGGCYLVDYSLTAMCLAFAFRYLKQASKKKKLFYLYAPPSPSAILLEWQQENVEQAILLAVGGQGPSQIGKFVVLVLYTLTL